MIQQENWKKMEFLSRIENSSTNLSGNLANKKPQQNPSQIGNKKIDFAKLFEDKHSK